MGSAAAQTITRPLGAPIDHSSLAFQLSTQSARQQENLTYQRGRADDLLRQAGELAKTIERRSRRLCLSSTRPLRARRAEAVQARRTAYRHWCKELAEAALEHYLCISTANPAATTASTTG